MIQGELFTVESKPRFPSTRYQGSKLRYVDWIWHSIKYLPFDNALDAFGGTGAVSYKLKQEGKKVIYNDILKFNSIIGKALIENSSIKLDENDINYILTKHKNIQYPNFIATTFADTYYMDDENIWLDMVSTNILSIECPVKKALAHFALFQACIIKRPYNLFHRKNLYIRTQDVERTFGNKVTWDTPFETHFRNFVKEANDAIFSNGQKNISLNCDATEISGDYDLVYIDTPYISGKGIGLDYHNFYHFLEGMVHYADWEKMIDYTSKHKRLQPQHTTWTNSREIEYAFEELIAKFKKSILVISYRSDGIPSIDTLKELLSQYYNDITIVQSNEIKYALSKKQSKEILIIAK